jgi:hypothetical protein
LIVPSEEGARPVDAWLLTIEIGWFVMLVAV